MELNARRRLLVEYMALHVSCRLVSYAKILQILSKRCNKMAVKQMMRNFGRGVVSTAMKTQTTR